MGKDTDKGKYGGYAAEAMADVTLQAREIMRDHLEAVQRSAQQSTQQQSMIPTDGASASTLSFGHVLGDMASASTPLIDFASAVRGGDVFRGEDVGYARMRPTTSTPFVSGLGYGSRLRFASQLSKLGREPMVVLSTAPVRVGGCYAMPGHTGQITIVLSQKVVVDSVEIVHVPHDAALPWATTSAMRGLSIKGWKHPPREGERKVQTALNMGEFEFAPSADISANRASIDEGVSQSFAISERTRLPVSAVTISFDSNHGNLDYTCVYRVRVHGTPQSAD
jgi:SUN domain-containing protein 1/2